MRIDSEYGNDAIFNDDDKDDFLKMSESMLTHTKRYIPHTYNICTCMIHTTTNCLSCLKREKCF